MEDKKNYTLKEVEKMFELYRQHKFIVDSYSPIEHRRGQEEYYEKYKSECNKSFEKCNKKIPFSLMNKLGIEKM